MKTWVVPGYPLTDGSGWKIWYAHPGDSAFTPRNVEVWSGSVRMAVNQTIQSLGAPKGLGRSITVATVKLSQPMPGQTFTVHIPELGGDRKWQTFPDKVTDKGVRFIFASCFWRNDDKEGYYYKAVDAVMRCEKPSQPAFKCLAGDQIYLDFPVPMNPFSNHHTKIADRYKEYWGDVGYQNVLATTPNFFLCDDHEWWNDYPESQRHLPHTYTVKQRKSYRGIAAEYYEAFQRILNPGPHRWYSFEIEPVSFFFADTRSARDSVEREGKTPQFMQADQWEALEQWQDNLTGPGILITGMPLFQKDGDWKDHSLNNFPKDNQRLLGLFTRTLTGKNKDERPHDIVILSGDIHTGRHCIARLKGHADLKVHELIASPASRVGPMLSEPEASMPSPVHPETGRRWGDIETIYTSVENNLGVIRLFPASKHPYKVRLEFGNYLVRPHRRPSWKFWASEPKTDFGNPRNLMLYENKNIYLK